MDRHFPAIAILLLVCACAPLTPPQPSAPVTPPPTALPPLPGPLPPLPPPTAPAPTLTPVDWTAVEGWADDEPAEALDAFLLGCKSLKNRTEWQPLCAAAAQLESADAAVIRTFFESRFIPHRLRNPDGSETGTITGYYVPDLKGSRTRSERFRYPIYGVPDDLLIIDLRSVYPELASYRLRGRLVGRKVVPYFSRAEIDAAPEKLTGKEIFWAEDPVELFFMQIQGSGNVVLEDGERVMVHFADQNGHPFRSIGKLLLERGAMTRDQMSMQNIRRWGKDHPQEIAALLAENPSYVFFAPLENAGGEAPGALGVPLTAGRSIAVDPKKIPLGAPVFLSTTWPSSSKPLRRLVLAQDTGGAIRGAVRADFYWGSGEAAGELAGQMKQSGRMWVLLPAPQISEAPAAPAP